MAIFQTAIGTCFVQSLASFRKKNDEIKMTSKYLVFAIAGSSLFVSFIVFGYLGYYVKLSGTSFEELPINGAD